MTGLVSALIVGLCAGWLAGQLVKGGGFGLVGDLVVGVLGALVGGPLVGLLGFQPTHLLGQILTATAGAIALIAVLRAIGRART